MPVPRTKTLEEIEVTNPHYEGATPGMVAKALMRPVKEVDEDKDGDKLDDDMQPTVAHSGI